MTTSKRPRRYTAMTLGGLLAAVALIAVPLSRLRPVSEREAVEVAFAALRASEPSLFRSDPAPTLADFNVHVALGRVPPGSGLTPSWSVMFTSDRYPVGSVTTIVGRRRGLFSGPSCPFVIRD